MIDSHKKFGDTFTFRFTTVSHRCKTHRVKVKFQAYHQDRDRPQMAENTADTVKKSINFSINKFKESRSLTKYKNYKL